MLSLRSNLVIGLAAIANGAVALVTVGTWGWNFAGVHAAARNSARFSGLLFAIAFAALGFARFVRGLPSRVTLLWAWFAAHLVHFASVVIVFATFERSNIAQHPGQTALVVLIGSGIVLGIVLTMTAQSGARMVFHNILLYIVFGIFTLAFIRDPRIPIHALAAVLLLALALRLTARFKLAENDLTSAG